MGGGGCCIWDDGGILRADDGLFLNGLWGGILSEYKESSLDGPPRWPPSSKGGTQRNSWRSSEGSLWPVDERSGSRWSRGVVDEWLRVTVEIKGPGEVERIGDAARLIPKRQYWLHYIYSALIYIDMFNDFPSTKDTIIIMLYKE